MKYLLFICLATISLVSKSMHKFQSIDDRLRSIQRQTKLAVPSLDENEVKTAQKATIKPLVFEDNSPKRYKCIIPNTDQFIMLDDNLIEHSKFLKNAIESDKSGDPIPLDKKWFKEVTLFDVKIVLEIIDKAQDKIAIQKELNKYIANKTPEKVVALCQVASYMDIQPLVDVTVLRLRKELVHKWQDKKFINSLNELPLDIQRLITPDAIRAHKAYRYTAEILNSMTYVRIKNMCSNLIQKSDHLNKVSPDTNKRTSISNNGKKLYITDTKTNEIISSYETADRIIQISWSLDSTKIALALYNRQILVLNIINNNIIFSPTIENVGIFSGQYHNYIYSLEFSPDGTKIVSGSQDGKLRIWNIDTGKLLCILGDGKNGWAGSVSWSPDGTKIAAYFYDKKVQIWHVEAESLFFATTFSSKGWWFSVKWSRDGDSIFLESKDYDSSSIIIHINKLLEEEAKLTALTLDQMLLFFNLADQQDISVFRYLGLKSGKALTQNEKKIFDKFPEKLRSKIEDKITILPVQSAALKHPNWSRYTLLAASSLAIGFGVYKYFSKK